MQLTYSAKLDMNEHTFGVLSAQALKYGQLKRTLYQWVAREGGSGPAESIKRHFVKNES